LSRSLPVERDANSNAKARLVLVLSLESVCGSTPRFYVIEADCTLGNPGKRGAKLTANICSPAHFLYVPK
jgi:hypothetical protein